MSTRVELPSGKFVELRDLSDLRSGDKRAAKGSVKVEIDSETGNQLLPGDYQDRMRNALAVRVILNWDFDLPLPRFKPSALDELTIEDSNALAEALTPYVQACNEAEADPTKEGTDPTSA